MLQYIGGKNRMSDWLWAHVPQSFNTYVEVFGGAFWNYINNSSTEMLQDAMVYYNDYNPFVANVMVCSQHEDFYHLIKDRERDDKELYTQYRHDIDILEQNREQMISRIPDFEIAWKYIYVLSHSHSGIYSSNRFRPFNDVIDHNGIKTEGGAGDKIRPIINRLKSFSIRHALQHVQQFTCDDFQLVVERHNTPDTFFYVDPPYYNKEYLYSFNEFGLDDHARVADTLKQITGSFLLSYYYFDDLEKWFPKDQYYWSEQQFTSSVNNNDSEKGLNRSWVNTEVLISNYKFNVLKTDDSMLEF